MLNFLFGTKKSNEIPHRLYGVVMARARDPRLFTAFGVPDTVMGRFDMLSLHVYLFSRRMKKDGSKLAIELGQEVFDCFTEDVERALRQLGIGDQTVPKRKKKMIRSFYGQIADFDPAFEQADEQQLAGKVALRFFEEEEPSQNALSLARYMQECDALLDSMPMDEIKRGQLAWQGDEPGEEVRTQ